MIYERPTYTPDHPPFGYQMTKEEMAEIMNRTEHARVTHITIPTRIFDMFVKAAKEINND